MIRRLIKWTFATTAALLLAGFLLTMFINFDCFREHQDVDITTGKLRYTRYLFSCKLSEKIEDSPLTEVLLPDALEGRTPEWRRVYTFSTPWHSYSPNYKYHGTISQIRSLELLWKMEAIPEDVKRKMALDVLALWQQGENDRLVRDYISSLFGEPVQK